MSAKKRPILKPAPGKAVNSAAGNRENVILVLPVEKKEEHPWH
jgi:hypothetical protein